MKITSQKDRIEALLNAIDDFQSLPGHKQDELQPLLDLTKNRFKDLSQYSETIHTFLDADRIRLTIT